VQGNYITQDKNGPDWTKNLPVSTAKPHYIHININKPCKIQV